MVTTLPATTVTGSIESIRANEPPTPYTDDVVPVTQAMIDDVISRTDPTPLSVNLRDGDGLNDRLHVELVRRHRQSLYPTAFIRTYTKSVPWEDC